MGPGADWGGGRFIGIRNRDLDRHDMSEHYLVKDDKRIELLEETTFGRSDDCDVKLTEGHPSRQHAKVTVADDGVWIEDLGSVNGTFINDNEVTERTRLVVGDMVSFDIESYRFESAVDDEATVMRPLPTDDEPLTVMRPIPTEPPEPPSAPPGGLLIRNAVSV